MSTPHFLVGKFVEHQRSQAQRFVCPICHAGFHQEPQLWAHARICTWKISLSPNSKMRAKFGGNSAKGRMIPPGATTLALLRANGSVRRKPVRIKRKSVRKPVRVKRKSVRKSREADPTKSQPPPKENNSPRPAVITQLVSPTRPGHGFEININDKGNLSTAQKNGSISSRSTPEYYAEAVSPNPNHRKRSVARGSEFQEQLADQQYGDRTRTGRRAKAPSGSPVGKDPEFLRESLISNEASLTRHGSSKRLFNPDTDNPSNTSRRNKAQDSAAARRIYDSRIHLFRSRTAPSGERDDFRHPKINQNFNIERIKLGKNQSAIQGVRVSDPSPNLQDDDMEQEPEILLQPETRPISHEELVLEVKGIYAGLLMVESKCIEVDSKQSKAALERDPSRPTKLRDDQWQALISLHKTLLHEHHDFFLASQHPSANPALNKLSEHFSMPTRMWRHGIHSFLEVLRHRLPESLDHMLAFLYIAYSMTALLYEAVSSFESTWIECLGDLGRYRMAIEDDKRDREVGRTMFIKVPSILFSGSGLENYVEQQIRANALTKQIPNLVQQSPRKEPITSRRDLPMIIKGRTIRAVADSGADGNFISSRLASELKFSIRKGKSDCKSFQLGNGKFMKVLGRIRASCAFAKDPIAGKTKCWFYVLNNLAVPMIMGSPFLEKTKTFSAFTQRLESRIPCANRLPMVNLIRSSKRSKNRLVAFIDNRYTHVCADTGSELDFMSPAHVKAQRYKIDRREECRKRVRLANNTVAETIGQVRATLSLDNEKDAGSCRIFDVLPGLPCEVLLGEDTLIETEAFTTHGSSFVELPPGSEEPLKLHLISYIGMKVCGVRKYFCRRRRSGARRNLPQPSAAKKRDDIILDTLLERDALERDAAEAQMLQQQGNPREAGSAAAVDAAQVVDGGEGVCTALGDAAAG